MKRGTPRHPKVGHLCDLLGVDLPAAVGTLELLWHFTAEFAPAGDVGRYDDARIAAALGWPRKKAEKLIEALKKSGWLDEIPPYRLVVHDWHDHADDAVRKRLSRAGTQFVSFADKLTAPRREVSEHVATTADNGSLPEPEPKPEPMPVPEPHTQPEPSARVRRAPASVTAMDLIGPSSTRFDDFWARWCELTRRAQRRVQAAQAWLSVAPPEAEKAIFECLGRYGESDEVSRGVVMNPDRWLFEQAQNSWEGDWPRAGGPGRQQQAAADWSVA